MANELVQVPFHGDVIDATQDENGDVWVPIRRPCEVLGLAPNNQIEKLKGKPWANGMMIISLDAAGRRFEMYALHLDCLPMWLATIDASRVKKELRAKLELYQKEAARVLADHFLGRKAEAPQDPGEDAVMMQLRTMLTMRQDYLAMQARQAATEARVEQVQEKVTALVAVREEAHRHLARVERSDEAAPDKPLRARINELVRWYCQTTDSEFPMVWNKLYKELYYRCRVDIRARAKNSGRSQLEEADAAGVLADLYAIASQELVVAKKD